jgi:hypothetical protein
MVWDRAGDEPFRRGGWYERFNATLLLRGETLDGFIGKLSHELAAGGKEFL